MQLRKTDALKAQVVEMRFFPGLQDQEIADLLQVTTRTIERYWVYPPAQRRRAQASSGAVTEASRNPLEPRQPPIRFHRQRHLDRSSRRESSDFPSRYISMAGSSLV